MIEEDDGGLSGLHNQLENLDREEDGYLMGQADDMNGEDMDEDEDEGQHHPDDDDDDLEEGQEINLESLGDLGQAAQQLGLDEEGLRALEMQKRMYDQRQMYEAVNLDYGEGQIEGVADSENQVSGNVDELDSDVKQQILRGGQNIEDD